MKNAQIHITLYTLIGKSERINAALIAHFADMTETVTDADSKRFAIRLKDDSEIAFSVNIEKAFIKDHLAGMHNFFAQVTCKNKKLRESVLRQILAFNCMAGSSFELDDNEDRTN